MSLRTLLLTKAFVSLVIGLGLMIAPAPIYGLLGATLAAGGLFAAREYASAMLGNLCLCWIARDIGPGTARRAIVVALFVYDALGLIVTAAAIAGGALNALGWGIAAIYLFFTAGFGWFLLAKPEAASPAPAAGGGW